MKFLKDKGPAIYGRAFTFSLARAPRSWIASPSRATLPGGLDRVRGEAVPTSQALLNILSGFRSASSDNV